MVHLVPPQSVRVLKKMLVLMLTPVLICVVLKTFWRKLILIKICSVFSFLIFLVPDPSFPLYLIVSCGKFSFFVGLFVFGASHN